MKNKNLVFLATSLDGYIADKNGGIGWLESIPNPEKNDCGYNNFINRVDAIVMGRATFEVVCGFDCPWPYTKPVFVVSDSLKKVSEDYEDKVEIINGTPEEIIEKVSDKGFTQLYIDGGATVQKFLHEDLIDELIITTIPILLGGGVPLFKELPEEMMFELVESEVYLNALVQSRFKRKR